MKLTMSTESASATGEQPEGERVHWRHFNESTPKPTANNLLTAAHAARVAANGRTAEKAIPLQLSSP